jgi:hypothetical protein
MAAKAVVRLALADRAGEGVAEESAPTWRVSWTTPESDVQPPTTSAAVRVRASLRIQ